MSEEETSSGGEDSEGDSSSSGEEAERPPRARREVGVSTPGGGGATLARLQLYCRTGQFLAVRRDGRLRGTPHAGDPDTRLEMSTRACDVPGDVRMRCLANGLYVAMRRSGRAYAEQDPLSPNTVFVEALVGSYNCYLSRRWGHLGYYLAVRRCGRVRRGPRTAWGQRATQFLPRREPPHL